MTYLGFHLAFNLPVLVLLFFLSGRGIWPMEMVLVMVGVLGIVVAFTSPWDNWAVSRGIWDFPPERVRFRVGRLPIGVRMTYLGFHLAFNLPVLVLLFFLSGRGIWPMEMVLVMAGVLGIVVAFTSPWDNWAVSRGIWDFPPERVRLRVGRLPIEEYAFFVIQSLEVMWLSWVLLRWVEPPHGASQPRWLGEPQVLRQIAFLLIVWVGIGVALQKWPERERRIHYAWHLLYWFLPVVALQWIVAGPMLWAYAFHVWVPTLTIGTYLCLADWYAIRQGIWFFDPKQITGIKIGGIMPWEEAAFFYITSLLVSQTFLILLPAGLR